MSKIILDIQQEQALDGEVETDLEEVEGVTVETVDVVQAPSWRDKRMARCILRITLVVPEDLEKTSVRNIFPYLFLVHCAVFCCFFLLILPFTISFSDYFLIFFLFIFLPFTSFLFYIFSPFATYVFWKVRTFKILSSFPRAFHSYTFAGKLYYGSYYYQKTDAYSNVISPGGMGGIGGGVLQIYSRRTIVDGRISVNGQDSPTGGQRSGCGGGSGGSIWITCDELDGYGSIQARGGSGSSGVAGGGSGGRIAVYYRDIHNYNGTFSVRGGTGLEPGASGTLYLEQSNGTHVIRRKLVVDNEGRAVPKTVEKNGENLRHLFGGVYRDITRVGTVTWLKESDEYSFDELVLQGNSHVALYGNASQQNVSLLGGLLVGDRSAVLHIGALQSVYFHDIDVYFPVNTFVYPKGALFLPKRVSLREVWMHVNGSLSDSEEYVIDRDGELYLWSGGNSEGEQEGTFVFVNVSVRARGRLHAITLPGHGKMYVKCTRIMINAGGKIISNEFHLSAVNITIDAAGEDAYYIILPSTRQYYTIPHHKTRKHHIVTSHYISIVSYIYIIIPYIMFYHISYIIPYHMHIPYYIMSYIGHTRPNYITPYRAITSHAISYDTIPLLIHALHTLQYYTTLYYTITCDTTLHNMLHDITYLAKECHMSFCWTLPH